VVLHLATYLPVHVGYVAEALPEPSRHYACACETMSVVARCLVVYCIYWICCCYPDLVVMVF
jgi:hypothetical protein